MDIEYKGANCLVMTTKKATIVVDPKLSAVGLKDITVKDSVELATAKEFKADIQQRIAFEGPGEYEVADLSVRGIAALRHVDAEGPQLATMYTISNGEVNVGVLGHVKAALSEQQLEELGTLDVLIIPVGGGGYTLDDTEAAALVRQIAPKVVIPTHYADKAIQYEVPQLDLAPFVKAIGGAHETVAKFKIKNGVLPDVLTLVEITRTA